MDIGDDMSIAEVSALARRLFGEAFNVFHQGGVWYVGRFLDKGRYTRGENAGREVSPWHRKQEIFGAGPTMRAAFRFAMGRHRVYSIGGMSPGSNVGKGLTPNFDRYGRVLGFTSPEGILHKTFPSDRIVTA